VDCRPSPTIYKSTIYNPKGGTSVIEMPTIMVPVDEATARAYSESSTEDQLRIQMLLRLQLKTLAVAPRRSLQELMDEIGAKAQSRGLTPEILDELLQDE